MEILISIAYFFLVRLVFFEYRWLKFTLVWKFLVFGLYAAAALTEIIMLGQYTPYSKVMFVQRPVIQMAPEFGGIVQSVAAKPNVPLKKGDVLFQMDPRPWQDRVDALKPQVDLARRHFHDAKRLVEAEAERQVMLERRRDELDTVQAELDKAHYNLDHATIVAPTDGYIANLQLRPGSFIRIKQPVMTFISTEEAWIIAMIPQRATGHVKPGDRAQIAFEMYPGKVFEAKVENVIFALGNAQLTPSGTLPTADQIRPAETFAVKLVVPDPDPEHPLQFGASGLASIFTSVSPDVFVLLRRIEIQSEAFLFYLYNPF
jgi:RND family efflux transporter MFP subunit